MNEDNNTKEYLEKLKGIKLSESSRSRIEETLLSYARFHSVRAERGSRSIEQVPSRTSSITRLLSIRIRSMTALLLIALMIGGGTSYAAEGAVPGDALYSLKTEVNEQVKSAFTVSNQAEAQLEARFAEERLVEAEKLAARGQLDEEASAQLSARLKTHYENAETRSEQAESEGDYESSAAVRASLEGAFRAHADILANLNQNIKGNAGASLIAEIRGYANDSAHAQATATVDTSRDVKAQVSGIIEASEIVITKAQRALSNAEGKIEAETYTRIEAHMKEAVAAEASAKSAFDTNAYTEAYSHAHKATRIGTEVQAMSESALRLKASAQMDTLFDGVVDVRTNGGTSTRVNSRTESNSTSEVRVESDSSVDIHTDIKTDVNTGGINASVHTGTEIKSGLGL